MSSRAWYSMLDMAEEHGWNPMGAVHPDWPMLSDGLYHGEYDTLGWNYTGVEPRLVMLDDSLNLADALERAGEVYEPVYVRYQELGGISLAGFPLARADHRPGLGTLECMVEFCRLGAFLIERPC